MRDDFENSSEVTAQALGELNTTAELFKGLTINGHSVLDGDITLSKEDVGLGNVENTSGSNLPVSTAMQEALDTKVDKTITVNSKALSGNIILTASDIGLGKVNNTSDSEKPISTATQAALDSKVDSNTTVNGKALSSNITITPSDIGLGNLETIVTNGEVGRTIGDVNDNLINHKSANNNPHGVTKTQVGLGNVDNTSDVDKPISNATKEAIEEDEKVTAQSLSELKEEIRLVEKTMAAAMNFLRNQIAACEIWKGTETEYANLASKDANTLYVIVPDSTLTVEEGGE